MAASRKLTTAREKPRGLYHDLGLRLVKLLNVLLIVLPFVCCWLLYYAQRVVVFPSPWRSVCVVGLFTLLYAGFGRVYDAFLVSIKRISELFGSQLLGILMADAFMFIVLWLMSGGFPNLFPALLALVGQLLLSLFWCKCANSWYFRCFSGQKTAIIYDHERGTADLFSQYGLNKKFDVRLICTVDECLRSGMDALDEMDAVFLCDVHSHDRNQILKYCVGIGVRVYVIPRIGDVIMSGAKRIHLFHLPMLQVGRYNPPPEFLLIKRTFDVLSSAAVILVTTPLMVAVAVAIKVGDGGPVFYRQTRLTKDGRRFQILNVRCMGIAGYSVRNSCAIAA